MKSHNFTIDMDLLTNSTAAPTQPYACEDAVIWLERSSSNFSWNIIFCFTKDIATQTSQQLPRIAVLPEDYSAKSKIHEYGGRSAVIKLLERSNKSLYNYIIYFCNEFDQRIYAINLACVLKGNTIFNSCDDYLLATDKKFSYTFDGSYNHYDIYYSTPMAITPQADSPNEDRFACPIVTSDGKYIFAVREQHFGDSSSVLNNIVAIPTDGSAVSEQSRICVIDDRSDFYSFLTISPDDKYLTYICWNHPNMPWDTTKLVSAELLTDANIIQANVIYQHSCQDISFVQPLYGQDGRLICISDITGWANLYLLELDKNLLPDLKIFYGAENDFAKPDWVIGRYNYCILPDGKIAATYSHKNMEHFVVIDSGIIINHILEVYTEFDWITADRYMLYCIASSPTTMPKLVAIDIQTGLSIELASRKLPDSINIKQLSKAISQPSQFEYELDSGEKVTALLYEPLGKWQNDSTAPPLIINIHGGPTGSVSMSLNFGIQFWSSRGFLVADLDFRGSSGHGRAYREKLDWGVSDREDARQLAFALIDRGLVDRRKIFIRGKSSGGFTSLSAIASGDLFAGAVSYYGVCDPFSLTEGTHKFERHYTESLISGLTDGSINYQERAIFSQISEITNPILVFHGWQDKIVPIAQSLKLISTLFGTNRHVELFTFDNEGHGFRGRDVVEFCYMAELEFYMRIISGCGG